MPRKPRRFSREFKARVALEAFKEQHTLAQLAAKYDVHPNQITKWKREARQALPKVFGTVKPEDKQQEQLVSSLYEKIGRLEMELDWVKKKVEQL
jgi:transposase-like protein